MNDLVLSYLRKTDDVLLDEGPAFDCDERTIALLKQHRLYLLKLDRYGRVASRALIGLIAYHHL